MAVAYGIGSLCFYFAFIAIIHCSNHFIYTTMPKQLYLLTNFSLCVAAYSLADIDFILICLGTVLTNVRYVQKLSRSVFAANIWCGCVYILSCCTVAV